MGSRIFFNPYVFISVSPTINFQLDALGSSATSSLTGVYSTTRLRTAYTGPIVNLRRSSDNITSDFYSDANGYLTTGQNGTGISYLAWVGSGTSNVVTWYDQSGIGNHATQSTQASQPTIDYSLSRVDFFTPPNSFLQIASPGCVPTGDGLYTCTLKHGTLQYNGYNSFFGSGNTSSACDFLYDGNSVRRYFSRWVISGSPSDAASDMSSIGDNKVVTYRYTTAGGALASKEFWVNGTLNTTSSTAGAHGIPRGQLANVNYIGYSPSLQRYANTQFHYITLTNSSVSNSDRTVFEGISTPPFYNFTRIFEYTSINTGDIFQGSISSDPAGNIFVGSSINFISGSNVNVKNDTGTVLQGTGSYNYMSHLTKFNSSGGYLWMRGMFGPQQAEAYNACDAAGNVYVSGWVNGSVTFYDPNNTNAQVGPTYGPSTNSGGFFAKFNPAGQFQYGFYHSVGGVVADKQVWCDNTSNVYYCGLYSNVSNSIFSNSGVLITTLPSITSNTAGFFAKFNTSGTLQYARTIDSLGNDVVNGGSGITSIVGSYIGTANVRNTAGTILATFPASASATTSTAFTARFDVSGNFGWAVIVDSTGTDEGLAVYSDNNGYTYFGGYYTGTATVKNNAGTTLLTLPASAGGEAGFVLAIDTGGIILWSRVIDSTGNDRVNAISGDTAGNIYVGGFYNGTATVKTGAGTSLGTLPASTGTAGFVIRFNFASGDFSTSVITNPGSISTLTVDNSTSYSNIIYGGRYNSAANVLSKNGTVITTLLTPVTTNNGFISKVSTRGPNTVLYEYPPAALSTGTTSGQQFTATLTGQSYGNGTYVINCSSSYSTSYACQLAFNKSISDLSRWASGVPANISSTSYSGAASLGGVSGEWISITLPTVITLNSYSIGAWTTQTPSQFVLLGSNNATSWTQIESKTGLTSALWGGTLTSNSEATFTLTTPASYSSFAIVAQRIFGATTDIASISELKLFSSITTPVLSNGYRFRLQDFTSGNYVGLSGSSLILTTLQNAITFQVKSDSTVYYNALGGIALQAVAGTNFNNNYMRHAGLFMYCDAFVSNNFDFAWRFDSIGADLFNIFNWYTDGTIYYVDYVAPNLKITGTVPRRQWRVQAV